MKKEDIRDGAYHAAVVIIATVILSALAVLISRYNPHSKYNINKRLERIERKIDERRD